MDFAGSRPSHDFRSPTIMQFSFGSSMMMISDSHSSKSISRTSFHVLVESLPIRCVPIFLRVIETISSNLFLTICMKYPLMSRCIT